MDKCYHCGEEIIFRHIDGVLRPMHIHGGWCTASRSDMRNEPARPPASYVISAYTTNDMCRRMSCQKCGQSVFFVRHNGGSVWFDELGYPWPKHACYDGDLPAAFRTQQPVHSSYSAADHHAFPTGATQRTAPEGMVLGLVVRVRSTPATGSTLLAIILETQKGRCVSVVGDTCLLLGELVTTSTSRVGDKDGKEYPIQYPLMDQTKAFDLPRDWLDNPT